MPDDTHHLGWRKSTHSTQNGSCVEVAPWRKSTHSTQNGDCVELAVITLGVAVRDSKDPDGPHLLFAPGVWNRFAERARDGELDLTTS